MLWDRTADYTPDYFDLGWQIWRQNYDAITSGTELVTLVDKAAGY